MKTWKKITILTTVTGVALGVLAYFAKKKSLEDDFSDESDDAFDEFDEFDDEMTEDEDSSKDRNYVPLDVETKTDKEDEESDNEDSSEADKEKAEADKEKAEAEN